MFIWYVKMQKSFQQLLRKQVGERSVWEYPFAVAGVNITSMLIQMLDLEPGLLSSTIYTEAQLTSSCR